MEGGGLDRFLNTLLFSLIFFLNIDTAMLYKMSPLNMYPGEGFHRGTLVLVGDTYAHVGNCNEMACLV